MAKKIIQCSNGKFYKTVKEANKDIGGYSTTPISQALKGAKPSAYGLRWKYVKEQADE